ncbi:hypothetical protein RhiTH_002917 [Rhizoctonia solani]
MPGNRTALMLVDIQYDFLPPNGSLAVANGADILPTVYDLLDHTHFDAYFASQGCEIEEGVQKRLERLEKLGKVVEYIKKGTNPSVDSYSAFADNQYMSFTPLVRLVYTHQIDRLVIVGLATDYCVRATAIDSRKFGIGTEVGTHLGTPISALIMFSLKVVQSGIRGVFPENESTVLEELKTRGCSIV